MSFVFGFVAGAVAVVVGTGAWMKHLEKTGQVMDLETLIGEMTMEGALVHIPERFPIVPTEEEHKVYVEVDNIRLVIEDGELVGWYDPSGELKTQF